MKKKDIDSKGTKSQGKQQMKIEKGTQIDSKQQKTSSQKPNSKTKESKSKEVVTKNTKNEVKTKNEAKTDDIDEIFSFKRPKTTPESLEKNSKLESTPSSSDKLNTKKRKSQQADVQSTNIKKKAKTNPTKKVEEDPFDPHSRGKARKYAPDGTPIYNEDELNIGRGGNTPLCPFDCDCCF